MDVRGKSVAVTGATGMLGVYIARALLAAGARVRGVVRNPHKAPFLAREGVEFVRADLRDPAALTRAFRGCDAVVANAALYSMHKRSWDDYYEANTLGTSHVYEAMGASGVPRAVHISSFVVHRLQPSTRPMTEHSPLIDGRRRQGGAYRATKQWSESLAFELSRKHGIATTVLRPSGIYGARDSNILPNLRRYMRLPVVASPLVHFPFVYAGDVARAVVGALDNDAAVDKAYLTAGRNDTVHSFLRAWKQVTNAKSLLVPVPLGPGLRVDTTLAEREIGFRNRSYEEGLRQTLESTGQR